MTHHGIDAYLCCIVGGGDQYAMRGDAVRLVARAEQLRAAVDGDGRVGALPFAGTELPVYSLAGLLGGARETRTIDRYVVVAGRREEAVGLLVDRVVRATTVAARELPLPAIAGQDAARWFTGLLTQAETSCLVLNPAGLRPGASGEPPAPRSTSQGRARMADGIADLVFVFTSAALPPCGGARHGVHASRLAAIVQTMPSVPLPGCAHHVAAIGAWRDAAVAVIDYSRGAIAMRTAKRLAVFRTAGGALVALPINADAALRRATAADARAADVAAPPYVRGVFQSGGERIALLDLERVANGECAAAAVSTRAGVPALV
jgi:chemotaxis signal transduction protein